MIKRHLECAGCGHVVATSEVAPIDIHEQGMAHDWNMRSDVVFNDKGEPECPMCKTLVFFQHHLVVPGGDI